MLNSATSGVPEAVVECLLLACEGRPHYEDCKKKLQSFSMKTDEGMHLVDDLGFESMEIATALAQLELKLGFDPLDAGAVSFTDFRTVNDLCKAFMKKDGSMARRH